MALRGAPNLKPGKVEIPRRSWKSIALRTKGGEGINKGIVGMQEKKWKGGVDKSKGHCRKERGGGN